MVRVNYLGIRNPEQEMVKLLPTLHHLEALAQMCAPFSPQAIAVGAAIQALQQLSVNLTGRPLRTRAIQDSTGTAPAAPSIEQWIQKERKWELARWETQMREARLRGDEPPYHLRPQPMVIQPLTLEWLNDPAQEG